MKVELKNVKGFDGPDSYCFKASLYVDGKKRGEVHDDGNGGCINFSDWDVEKELDEYGKTLPKDNSFGIEIEIDANILVGDALNAYEETKFLKRTCKKKTVFSTPKMPKGEYKTVNSTYSPQVKAWVLEKYPDAVIYNERFV